MSDFEQTEEDPRVIYDASNKTWYMTYTANGIVSCGAFEALIGHPSRRSVVLLRALLSNQRSGEAGRSSARGDWTLTLVSHSICAWKCSNHSSQVCSAAASPTIKGPGLV